jgi:hypothetical protein
MTLLIKGLMSLITVFAKEKFPNRKLGKLSFISVDDVIVSFRILILQILLMTLNSQGFSCNFCLI